VTYAFIAAHSGKYPVTRMCKVLKVPTSGYYDWLKRPVSRRQQANKTLLGAIRRVYKTSRCTYGTPLGGGTHPRLACQTTQLAGALVQESRKLAGFRSIRLRSHLDGYGNLRIDTY